MGDSLVVEAENFRVERCNEVALHFDEAKIEMTSNRVLIVTDLDTGKALAIYNSDYWEAVIFNDHS